MNLFKTDFNGGLPVFLDDIRFMDAYNRDAFKAIISAFGLSKADSYRLSGADVIISGATVNVSAGYICLEGEVYAVAAHSIPSYNTANTLYWDVVEIAAMEGNKVFQNTQTHNTYIIRTAVVKQAAGSLAAGSYMPHNAPYLMDKIRQPLDNKVDKGIVWKTGTGTLAAGITATESSRPYGRWCNHPSGVIYVELCFRTTANITANTRLFEPAGLALPAYMWQKYHPCTLKQNGTGVSSGHLYFTSNSNDDIFGNPNSGKRMDIVTLTAIPAGWGIQETFILIP